MFDYEKLLPPIPQSACQQFPPEVFKCASTCVELEEISRRENVGYFLPGDTVILERSSGVQDEGWAYVGTDATNEALGIFVKMIDGHRARKLYPFHWDKV